MQGKAFLEQILKRLFKGWKTYTYYSIGMWQSVHMCILPREIVDHVVMAMDFYGTYVKNTIEDNIIPSNQSLKYMV